MKKFIRFILVFVLSLSISTTAFAAVGISNFEKTNTYTAGTFVDIPSDAWYQESVQAAYELGLMKGSSETTFHPAGKVTIGEAITLASRLHNIYYGSEAVFSQGDPWYQVYVDYAVAHGIVSPTQFHDYNIPATRAQFAVIFAASFPTDAFTEINHIALGAIPDVTGTESYGAAVYLLYNAGILTGSDRYGTFHPDNTISRSEVAAIVTRMADKSLRRIVTLDTKPEPTFPPSSSSFSIHFIDVGQADAALVECDGKYMLIDGGNRADSSLVYTVLKNANVKYLDILVATHAHEDHVGGLAGALQYAKAGLVLCPVTAYSSDAFNNFKKYAGPLTVPSAGAEYSLGSAKVKILGVNGGSDPNNTSIVLKITYGATSFLFTGDAERAAEQAILNSGYGAELSSTVLKVGHHGSENSTTYPFLRQIMPQYAVISVGEGNSYGHPTEAALSRLRDANVKVFRTDLQGDVFCTSDGKTVVFRVEKNANANTLGDLAPQQTGNYILNISTMKFHVPSCSSVGRMSEKNKQSYTGPRSELIQKGYSPCDNCHP